MSKKLEDIFNFAATSDDCIKCGKCIPVCTIPQVHPPETTSPRGFIDLLGAYQKGDLELDKNAKDIFESCFLCTNCVEVGPNALATDMVIEEVRADIADKFGIAWFKRGFFFLLLLLNYIEIGMIARIFFSATLDVMVLVLLPFSESNFL